MKKIIFLILMFIPFMCLSQTDSTIVAQISELAKPVYIEAYKTVYTAKHKLDWALKKHIKNSEAINYYNVHLGPYMGTFKTINEIKNRLDKSGEAYIEYRYSLEKARIAKMFAEKFKDEEISSAAEESYNNKK